MNINLDISGSKDVIYVDEQDTSTSIVFYIKDNGSAVDLTGLTLSFVLHRTSYIVAPLTITSASSGIATLTLTSAMTASPGTLAFEVVGMESDDTPEFDISSYMVVQKVYSGSDGQNDPDEENPGIDVLYGEEAPDDETDGEDKDFYFELSEGSGHVINENDYEAYTDATHPISITSFTRVSDTEYNFNITGTPSNDGNGENIFINLTGLIEGEQYTITFDAQYSSGTTFPYYPQYDTIADIRSGTGTSLASEVLQSDTQKHSHTITFTASAVNKLHFFLSSKDNVSTTLSITNLIIDGDIQFVGEIEEFYNKHQSKWLKYNRVKEVKVDGTSVVTDDVANINTMIGATSSTDGTKGLVPQPLIADKDKFFKGDGTWAEAQGASAVSDLTDVELTNLADKEILEWDAVAEKWKNVANSGGGGGNALILDAQIYSFEERVIGVWTDGKPLYQISFDVGNLTMSNNTWTYFNKTIPNGVAIKGELSNYYRDEATYPIYVTIDGNDDRVGILQSRGITATFAHAIVTVWYTKTTDSAGSGGYQAYGFSPIIYSEEEREVGVWIDNKPLYQKTFVQQLSGQSASIDISSYDMETAFIVDGYYDIGVTMLALNETLGGNTLVYTHINTGLNPPYIDCRNYISNNSIIKITVAYTKTTDTAGSGSYNTLGVPNVHYTENEQVIGTYLGKPLYQKTIVTNMASGATTCDIPFTGCNIKRMVDLIAIIDGTSSSGNAITCTINGIVSGNNGAITIKSLSSNGAYGFFDDAGVQIKRAYAAWFEPNMQIEVTIKYTKTTD